MSRRGIVCNDLLRAQIDRCVASDKQDEPIQSQPTRDAQSTSESIKFDSITSSTISDFSSNKCSSACDSPPPTNNSVQSIN